MDLTRDELVARLTKAGELDVSGADQAELDSYFDTRQLKRFPEIEIYKKEQGIRLKFS